MQRPFSICSCYINSEMFQRNQLQLVYQLQLVVTHSSTLLLHFTTLYSAAKYNEREEDVPDLLTIEDIAKQPIPNDILLKYELWTLQKMGWKLTGKTSIIIQCILMISNLLLKRISAWYLPTRSSFNRFCHYKYHTSHNNIVRIVDPDSRLDVNFSS